MQSLNLLFIVFALIGFNRTVKPVDQIKGAVCFKIDACEHMIVCLKDGNYSIVQDYYDKCEEDDLLVGDFKSYGWKDAYNLTQDKSIRVYVEDWEYSQESAIEEWKEHCK